MQAETPKILVVDEEQEFRTAVCRLLEPAYDVSPASNGTAALELVSKDTDIAIVARRLPDMPGHELAKHIHDRHRDCQITFVTTIDPGIATLDLGCDDYLVKPVHAHELETSIEKLLTRTQFDRKVREKLTLGDKLRTLEETKSGEVLTESKEYAAAKTRHAELTTELKFLRTQSVPRESVSEPYPHIDSGRNHQFTRYREFDSRFNHSPGTDG